VLPVLIALVFGIIEFGFAFNSQITLTHAAREGVRSMAINNNPAAAQDRAVRSAVGLGLTASQVKVTTDPTGGCAPGRTATVTITYPFTSLTGIVGSINLTGRGSMQCGG
jgi:Flp pilus assembly protein TadG